MNGSAVPRTYASRGEETIALPVSHCGMSARVERTTVIRFVDETYYRDMPELRAAHAACADVRAARLRQRLPQPESRRDLLHQAVREGHGPASATGKGSIMTGTAKERLIALALSKVPPTSLRLGMLEMAGMGTNEALEALGIHRTHRYRAIADLRRAGIAEPRPVREEVLARRGTVPSRRVTWKQYAQEHGLSGDWMRALRYSMEPQAMHAIYLKQDGRCYLCGDPLPANLTKVHVEHDHACCPPGKQGLGSSKVSCGNCVRGLSCSGCNRLLGIAQDDPYRLRRIADNLEGANHRVATAQLRVRWLAGSADECAS